ncbi:phosphonate ABC transporter substrate-binding protein [Aliihoeflea aestuarii]|jgi:phosphonate transport system substrate-binding protein|uniref:phosphonate ABC transporter substrate-binding protein n=1 Tax=Aliihoeflea aestuarii TaxID=453840 RepID=UPI002093F77B|nr:phosphonate ABC transporter substrate-binding protein [Aliihoeflea aestuarii]MCO6390614.1 phosphonate ABC transporter substrate-binding protein [Aliihoeflea aestuarii]
MIAHLIRTTCAAAIAASALVAPAAAQDDWKSELPVFRVGLLGGENEADRLRRNECLVEQLSEALGVPVELFPASDYAGVMQGLLAGQLDTASLGASGYAGIYLQDPEAVEPVFVSLESDGSNGYYAMMYAKSDSGIEDLEDMQGKSLAFADPNSTSGYLVPKAELEAAEIDIETYFSRTGFGGGHEQAVVAVLNDQYDAGVTWTSGQGEQSQGFSRGNLHTMVNNGLLDMNDLSIIWTSNLIPNGPWVVRKEVPQEAKDIWTDWMANLAETDYECYKDVSQGEGPGFERVDHSFFEGVVAMRERELQGSR